MRSSVARLMELSSYQTMSDSRDRLLRLCLRIREREEVQEPGVGHHGSNVFGDSNQHELAFPSGNLAVEQQQQAQAGAGEIVDLGKIQDQLRVRGQKRTQLLPHFGCSLAVQTACQPSRSNAIRFRGF